MIMLYGFVDFEEADYFLSEYRNHEDEYPYDNEVFSINYDPIKIMVVYKR